MMGWMQYNANAVLKVQACRVKRANCMELVGELGTLGRAVEAQDKTRVG